MDRQDSTLVPRIVVTEPSPISVPTQSTTESVIRYIEPIPEDLANGSRTVANPARVALEQAVANLETGTSSSSGEFKPAKDCNECVVSVTEQSSSDGAETTATLEADHDLRIGEEGCCSHYGFLRCIDWYEKVWTVLNSLYMLPVWLLLLGVPISAGIEGAFYIYSCPASHSLSLLIFIVGISLMIVIVSRICLIIGRVPVGTTTQDYGCMRMLHTLLLISSFLTTIFFVTETVSYWKMKPSTVIGDPNFCEPSFLTFAFWWNCVMSVLIVPIFLFPA